MKSLKCTVIICITITVICSCGVVRPVIYNLPGENDARLFPFRTINPAPVNTTFYFTTCADTPACIKNIKLDNKGINATGVGLNEFVELHNTISLAIIRNDSILYQHYTQNYSAQSYVTSFSIAKSFITMLTGIAIQEGYIKSELDPITNYIEEWKGKAYDSITIKDLLRHTSGLRFSKSPANPESDQVKFYYGKELRKNILDCPVKETPGLHFDYQSENPSLLALILERATGRTVSEYLQQKIWNEIGTEAPALWNTDRNDSLAIEKAFCCLNAHTLDFAKFARLLLNKGKWNGKQLIPEAWIEKATNRSNELGGKISYGYNLGLGPSAYNSFFAMGLYGQLLYIYPQKNIIIVRFGGTDIHYQSSYWKEIMLQLIDQL